MSDAPEIRPAIEADAAQVRALLPQLADFDVPERRNPDDLWAGDVVVFDDVLAGRRADCLAHVAAAGDKVLGLIIVTMRDELMSHAPSAHLEAIVVHPDARCTGLGRRLLAEAEQLARARGAQSISLHVFAKNERALSLYKADGYDPELIRAIKWFD